MIDTALRNKQPLNESAYAPLPLGAVQLTGFGGQIRDKIISALTYAIDRRQGVFQEDSVYLGGSVYTPDMSAQLLALTMAACADGDETLEAFLRRFVHICLDSAQEDGRFGPIEADLYDHALLCRMLAHYYTDCADKQALKVMVQYFHYLFKNLESLALTTRDQAMMCELIEPMLWLYNLTGYPFLRRLCAQISRLSQNWTGHFTAFGYTRDLKQTLPDAGRDKDSKAYFMTEGAANAAALKYPALIHAFLGGNQNADAPLMGLEKLMQYHGQPQGLFSCDAHLSGTHPSGAVSTQAICNALDSLTVLCAQNGDIRFADAAEMLAFNALPGAFAPDFMHAQRYGCANQIGADIGGHRFYNAPQDALVFAPTDPAALCGFAHYARMIAMKSEKGLALLSYPDAQITWVISGTPVRVRIEGGYPAGEIVTITVRPKKRLHFALDLRIPTWAQDASAEIDGQVLEAKAGEYLQIERDWEGSAAITLRLPLKLRMVSGYRQSASLYAGALLMALPLNEDQRMLEEDCFALKTVKQFGYALCDPEKAQVVIDTDPTIRFKGAHPVSVKVSAVPVSWSCQGSDAGAPPVLPDANGQAESLTLKPFGQTTLRISRFPICQSNRY